MIYKLKYRDLVKPHLKAYAQQMKAALEEETGLPHKIKSCMTYSDEMRIEIVEDKGKQLDIKEEPNDDSSNPPM